MADDAAIENRIDSDDPIGCSGVMPRWCMTCAHSNGEPPWADSPLKSYCVMYPRDEGLRKPAPVYYEGAECEFYREETRWR